MVPGGGLLIDAAPRAGGFSIGGSTVGLKAGLIDGSPKGGGAQIMGRRSQGGWAQGGPRASSRAQGPGQIPRLAPRQGMKRRRRDKGGKGEDSD